MPQLSPAEWARSSYRISSIWNDALMFSIRTHALMHPCPHTAHSTQHVAARRSQFASPWSSNHFCAEGVARLAP